MPAGDRSGPMGFGPMTGRGMGLCGGNPGPGYMFGGPGFGFGRGFGRGFGYGRGLGRGMGFGRGRGLGQGRGWGRGWFGRFGEYPQEMPFWGPYGPPTSGSDFPQASSKEELQYLKEEEEFLNKEMKSLKKRIEELEKKDKKETA